MNQLIWVHPDCLAADNPAYLKYPKADAVFVFDEAEIEAERWSLKRIAFLYETLLELPLEIERGDVVAKLLERKPARIVTVASVNPRFGMHLKRLQAVVPVEVISAVPFVDYRGNLDLKRFSRYWKRVEPFVFDK
jgi:hypothetical protein